MSNTVEFLVIGAESGGCTVANRLWQDRSTKGGRHDQVDF